MDSMGLPTVEGERGSEAKRIYETIREDILEGRLVAEERLKISSLAARYGTSAIPVREALQQLRGEGFVTFSHNVGAFVRAIDEAFIRDNAEITAQIEPYLVRWAVSVINDDHIHRMERIQAEIEERGFEDHDSYATLDEAFHRVLYDEHYNRQAVDLWWRNREIIKLVARRFDFPRARRAAIIDEHRSLIEFVREGNVDAAMAVAAKHATGSGNHVVERMRAKKALR
ncbi:GntR family transcriptional regulator [Sinorhizobium medicae]|nr:GntR family transcriptional regulator [Sinorhizobium medicae]RVQ60580.1 GntR family transcriptional regulator [Sinorhizobium medicae]